MGASKKAMIEEMQNECEFCGVKLNSHKQAFDHMFTCKKRY